MTEPEKTAQAAANPSAEAGADAAVETPEAPVKETSGEYLMRVLKPAGCIFVLLCMIAYFIFCLTWRAPAEGTPETATPAAAETSDGAD